jgi:hypothetical protein
MVSKNREYAYVSDTGSGSLSGFKIGTISTFEMLDGGGLKPVATLGSLPTTATGLAVR